MKIPVRHNPAGIALIIVMIAIFVMSAMAVLLWYSMKVETTLAHRADSEGQLLWLGRSGVELARYVLSEEATIPGEPYSALNQIWAGGPGGPGETNSPLNGISLNNYQIGDGTVSITITDLERKVNINTANPKMIQQALTLMGVNADVIATISDSIVDWIDDDDTPGLSGAESDYYQSLVPPYYAKNSPIDDLSELLLVKGIQDNPEIYWGGSATNLGSAPSQSKLGLINSPFQNADYPFGLKDIFTPISAGLININTADTNVLQMIPGVDGDVAAAIVQQRAGPDGIEGTDDDTPLRSPSDFTDGRLDSSVCGVHSYTFEVHVIAQYAGFKREYIAILFRNSGTDIQLLNFYWIEPKNPSAGESPATSQDNPPAN